jgi:CRISPR-associated protein Cmr4
MYKKAMAMFMLCETSVHAGSGSELGIVDLPIQREKHTDYPVFHSSSIKGALRFNVTRAANSFWDAYSQKFQNEGSVLLKDLPNADNFNKMFEAVFGERDSKSDEESFASAIAVTDGRILLFPVKSLKGTFAYVTCPFVLNRLKRDLSKAGINLNGLDKLDFNVSPGNALITNDSEVAVSNNMQSYVTLEEFTLSASANTNVENLSKILSASILPANGIYKYLKSKIEKSLVVLSDDDFKEFVSQSTEVVARIKIDEKTGTVSSDGGNLWYEENLPSESIMYSLVFAQDLNEGGKKKVGLTENVGAENVLSFVESVIPERIQLGGNETIGRGIITLTFQKGK